MPRSVKDSDEEPRAGRRARTLSLQSVVDSPVRRSNRLKQPIKKLSPDSDSDASISSNQAAKTTRQRTATMDSTIGETLRSRKKLSPSVSSESSEIIDVDVGTPSKRVTRRSVAGITPSTPTRASARVTSKRFVRAESETKLSSPARVTRRTRSNSVDPEIVSHPAKSSLNVPSRLRTRTSMLISPAPSPVKEEVEKSQPKSSTKIDTILVEADEFSSGNDSSTDKAAQPKESQEIKEMDIQNKDKVEESHDETSTASNKAFQIKSNEIHSNYIVETKENKNSDKVQNSYKDLPTDVDKNEVKDTNSQEDKQQANKSKIIECEESLADIENSLINICKKSPTKELTVRLENILVTPTGGVKNSPGNKENQTLNIIRDVSPGRSVGPIISNVTSLSAKSLTTVFANIPLEEKEVQFARSEPGSDKHRRSIETATKQTCVLKGNTDNIEETARSQKCLVDLIVSDEESVNISVDETTKIHDVDKNSKSRNNTIKSVSSLVDLESVEKVVEQISSETTNKSGRNSTETSKIEMDETIVNTETHKSSQESSCCLSTNDDNNKMLLVLEESFTSQDKNKSPNKPLEISAELNPDRSNESIHVEVDNEFTAVERLAYKNQDNAKNNSPDFTEQTKRKRSFGSQTKLEFSNTAPTSLKKAESPMNVSSKIAVAQRNEDTLDISLKEKSQDLVNEEINNSDSDVDVVSMFRDIPADEWKEDEARKQESTDCKLLMENESEAECDLVLVDKQVWLAAESMKATSHEDFDYESDDSILLKSILNSKQAYKTKLSTINETLLVNIDGDNEGKEEAAKSVKTQKSLVEGISDKHSATICINNSSSSVEQSLNKSGKVLNTSSGQPTSKLNKSKDKSIESLDVLSDENGSDAHKLNKSLQARKKTLLRKSTETRELNKSLKDTPSKQSPQNIKNNSASKSRANKSAQELDDGMKTRTERNLKKTLYLKESEIEHENTDDEVGSKCKNSDEESDKEDKNVAVNLEESDKANQTKDSKLKSDKNDSTFVLAGLNDSDKSSDDESNNSIKHYKCINSLFEKNSDTDDDGDGEDGDGIGSIDSDVKREYNLDGSEQSHSDDNVIGDDLVHDLLSESESSDSEDNGSDLDDFIVADDAIEDAEDSEEEESDENEEEEEEEEKEEEEILEDKEGNDEMNSVKVDWNEKSAGAETNAKKNNTFDKSKEKISTTHNTFCQSETREDTKAKKSDTKKLEETVELDYSSPSMKKKRKSHVDETEQNSMKKSENKKKPSMGATFDCSTPKINSSGKEFMNDETAAIALQMDYELNNTSEMMQSKKKKSKRDSTLKEDIGFKEPTDEETIFHANLPSDLLEKKSRTKLMSKTALNKTMNAIHTEVPAISNLRKEKLSKSAPQLISRIEADKERKKRFSKDGYSIVQRKVDESDNDDEIPNLLALFNDDVQELSQYKKEKKRKKQMVETSSENIIENVPLQDTVDLDVKQPKKKKKKVDNNKYNQVLTIEDTTPQDVQPTEKKKKKAKVTKIEENVKEDNIQEEEKETLHMIQDNTLRDKKKKQNKVAIESNNTPLTVSIAKKKEDDKNTLSKKPLKKKEKQGEVEKEKIIPQTTEVLQSKSKLDKKSESNKLQNVPSKIVESKNATFAEIRNEAIEAIKSATERIKQNNELKKKKKNKQEDILNTIQEKNVEMPIKRKKTEKHPKEEKQKVLPSSSGGLKRLSNDVINQLADEPRRVKKRKLDKDQVMPSMSQKNPKIYESKVKKNSNFISLSSDGSTTQFTITNIAKTKKQSSQKITTAMSYKQRILNKNTRQPISSYLMYLKKQHATSKDGFSTNAF